MKQGAKSDILYVNFMKPKPGKGQTAYKMEHDLFQKIHQARVNSGEMSEWLFLSRSFPSGTDAQYNYVTMDGHPASPAKKDEKAVRAALTKEEWDQMPNVGDVRTRVRQEIWRPVVETKPASK